MRINSYLLVVALYNINIHSNSTSIELPVGGITIPPSVQQSLERLRNEEYLSVSLQTGVYSISSFV